MVSFAMIITINSARRNNNSDVPWPRKLFRGRRLRLHEPIFAKFSSWLTALANKPTNDDLLNLTRDGCEHGTHLFCLSFSLALYIDLLLRSKNVLRSFVLHFTRLFVHKQWKRRIFLAFI